MSELRGPGILDLGTTKCAWFVQGGLVAEHSHEPDPPRMLPATAPDLQNLYILLAVALVERPDSLSGAQEHLHSAQLAAEKLVRLHVAVDPHLATALRAMPAMPAGC